MLRALEQAARSGSVAETVLLAHRIVGNLDLAEMHPADAASIVAALMAIGQQDTARALSAEVAAAHLMAALQSVEIVLPPRTELAASGTGAEEGTGQAAADAAETADTEMSGDETAAGTGADAQDDGTSADDATDTGSAVKATDDANADSADSDTDAGSATQAATGAQQDANADS